MSLFNDTYIPEPEDFNYTQPAPSSVPTSNGGTFLDGGYIFNSPISLLLVQIIIITSLSRGLGFIIGKIKEPMVVAEMLAGIILGPTVLGRIPGFTSVIFPKSSESLLSIVANLGLILFMFVVGLEIDFKEFRSQAKSSLFASVSGVVVPFIFSIPMIFLLYTPELVNPEVNIGVFYLFLSVVMGISALPVLARILSEYHFLGSPIGVFTMSATAFDDLLAWPLLALAIALTEANNPISILYIFICMAGLLLLLIFPIRLFFNWLVKRLDNKDEISQSVLLLILIVTFSIAWFCEVVGLTGLIGAFSVGLVVPRVGNLSTHISERIEDLVVIIFMPLYFTLSGLRTQFALLDNGTLWGYTFLIIFVTLISKMIGCALPTRLLGGFSWPESFIFGVLMNTKGLVALISLNLGLSSNLITSKLFAMLIIMVLINTMIPCPTVALIYRFFKLKSPDQLRKDLQTDHPNFKVLVAINNRETAPFMISIAKALGMNQRKLELLIIRLLESSSRPSEIMGWRRRERKDDVIIGATQQAKIINVPIKETLYYMSDDFGQDIVKDVTEKEIDLLLVGCHHKRVRGQVVDIIKEKSPSNVGFVLGVKEDSVLGPNMVFLYREKKHDFLAAKIAINMAESQNMKLIILHVVPKKPQVNSDFINLLLEKTFIDYKLIETKQKYKKVLAEELTENLYSLAIIGLSSTISKEIQTINPNLPVLAIMDIERMERIKEEKEEKKSDQKSLIGEDSDNLVGDEVIVMNELHRYSNK